MNPRIIVVGGLAAGPAAAAKAKRTNPNADVLLLEAGEYIAYGICEIPYSLGGTITEKEDLLPYTPGRFKKEKGVTVKVLHHAERVYPGKRQLVVRDFNSGRVEELPYDRLILATGSTPKRLGVKGEEARNVFRIKSFAESNALHAFLTKERPSKAVIIGAGYIGMEMAEALTARGIDTTVLHQNEDPMMGLEPITRKAVAAELAANKVRHVPHCDVKSFRCKKDGAITGVSTGTEHFETDLVLICIGVEPNTALAKEALLRVGKHGGLLTDQRQVTNVDNIYAAGDCCEIRNLVNNKLMYNPLATVAARQGRVAGENAAGGSAVFKGALKAVAVKVFSLEVARVGLNMPEAEESSFDPIQEHIVSTSRVSFFPGSQSIHVVLVADKKSGRVLGANVFGREGAVHRANILAAAIQHRLTVEALAHLDLIYTPPFSPLWDPITIAGHQLTKRIADHEKPRSD